MRSSQVVVFENESIHIEAALLLLLYEENKKKISSKLYFDELQLLGVIYLKFYLYSKII